MHHAAGVGVTDTHLLLAFAVLAIFIPAYLWYQSRKDDKWRAESAERYDALKPRFADQSADRYVVGALGGESHVIETFDADAVDLAIKESLHNGGKEVYLSGKDGRTRVYLRGYLSRTFR
ncbi:hypothetical protein [Streptosporangium amethystogenes]|uniref:hypothetical protein n=1 Tax=Streptosporangium amethystogenes TaxID=2002 RepID=UPI0004C8120E|nr:hypothetical protein [Streptosporangium amethystogenes]